MLSLHRAALRSAPRAQALLPAPAAALAALPAVRTPLQPFTTSAAPAPKEKLPPIDSRVWPIAGSSFLMGTGIGVVIPVLPLFARDLGLSSFEFGAVVSVLGLSRLLLNIPSAIFADRVGRKPLLVAGPLATAASLFGTGLSSSATELISWRFLTGAGGSAQMTGAQCYLADISTPKNRARTMAPMAIAFQCGFALGPSLAGFIAEGYGLRAPFYFVGGAISLVALSNYILLPETLVKGETADHQKTPVSGKEILQSWRALWKNVDVRRISVVHSMFWVTSSGSMFTLMPLYASQQFGVGVGAIGALFSMFAVVGVVGAQPSAWISDKYGRKKVIVPALVMLSSAIGMMPFVTSANQLYAVCTLWAIGGSLMGSSPTAYISDVVESKDRSQALGLLRSAGDVGLLLGAGSLGLLAQVLSIPAAFEVNALLLSACTLSFALRAKESTTFGS